MLLEIYANKTKIINDNDRFYYLSHKLLILNKQQKNKSYD